MTKVLCYRDFVKKHTVDEVFKTPGEPGGGVSKTVPDQAFTLREMLQRFTRGQAGPESFDVQHVGEDESFAAIDRMNYLDKLELGMNLKKQVEGIQRKRAKDQAQSDLEESIAVEMTARLMEQKKPDEGV